MHAPSTANLACQYPTRITPAKAMELANLVLIAYNKNLKFVESMAEFGHEPFDLFPDTVMCNDNSEYDDDNPEHLAAEPYQIASWIWTTEQMGLSHAFRHRTLPFGFIAHKPLTRELFIILRGTITSSEWKNNVIAVPTSSINGATNLGMVHAGFNRMFNATHKEVSELHLGRIDAPTPDFYGAPNLPERSGSIKEFIAETVINADWHRRGYRIYIAGHSLGGALAMLAGFQLLTHDYSAYKDILSVCTFGSPRVGNQDFCDWFRECDVVRYANTEDVVPTVPPSTVNLFGSDMKETNSSKVLALREAGYRQLDDTFGATKGLDYNANDATGDEAWQKRAYVHSGEHRSFTINKGSISYNHNMKETYRRGIMLLADGRP